MKNNYQDLKYHIDNKTINVKKSLVDNSFWLSNSDISSLFDKSKSTISKRINYLMDNKYANDVSVVSKIATTGPDGKEYIVNYYRFELIEDLSNLFKSEIAFMLKSELNNQEEKDIEKTNESIIYNNGNVCLDVKISPLEDTVWLTQNQIADLFETSRQNVGFHIKNIIEEGELSVGKNYLPTAQDDTICKELIHTSSDGKNYIVNYYNLDMILAIGYRVKGDRAIQFRKWASSVLKQYLIKGYAIDKERSVVTYQNFIKLEEEVEDMKVEIKNIKEKMFIEPVKERLFFNGEFFDAYEFICSLVGSANKRVTIIDPYFDLRALSILEKTKPDVQRLVYCTFPSNINKRDKKEFRKQYGYLDFFVLKGFHDRFIILDESICYSIGTSLNSVGRNTFAVNKIEDIGITKAIIKRIGQCLFHEE